MGRNLLVLIGVLIVIGSSLLLPLTSTGQKIYGMDPYKAGQLHLQEESGIVIGIAILLVLLLKGQLRGIIWMLIGLVGISWTFFYAASLIVFSTPIIAGLRSVGEPPPPPSPPASFEIGLLVTLIGYALVIAGGIWDTARKRKSTGNQNVPEKLPTT